AVGGVKHLIFTEAHSLDIVEPGAPGRSAPDGMAPIEHSSARHRCQRHGTLLFTRGLPDREGVTLIRLRPGPLPLPSPPVAGRGGSWRRVREADLPFSSGTPAFRTCR